MWNAAWRLASLGRALAMQGQYSKGLALLTESLRLFRRDGDGWGIALGLRDLGLLTAEYGDHERAARLLGAAEGLLAALDATLAPRHIWGPNDGPETIWVQLDRPTVARAYDEGSVMTAEQAITYALQGSSSPG